MNKQTVTFGQIHSGIEKKSYFLFEHKTTCKTEQKGREKLQNKLSLGNMNQVKRVISRLDGR